MHIIIHYHIDHHESILDKSSSYMLVQSVMEECEEVVVPTCDNASQLTHIMQSPKPTHNTGPTVSPESTIKSPPSSKDCNTIVINDDRNSDTTNQVDTHTPPPLFIPTEAEVDTICKTDFHTLNHLSNEMKIELSTNKASEEDIIDPNTNKRSNTRCQAVINKLFPKGRKFSSITQLNQMATAIGESWGFLIAREGYSFW